mgnify:FL=1
MSRFSPRNIMIHMIRLYQKYISPMKRTKCPYIPTCSQYGLEAIEKYGALKGGLLAVWRNFALQSFFTWRIRSCAINCTETDGVQ